MTPTVIVRRWARLRAMRLGRYPSRSAAATTALRERALTFGESRITRLTSARETPAARATSSKVGCWATAPSPQVLDSDLGRA